MRVTSTGLRPDQLPWALQKPDLVETARANDSCLLCRAGNVNEAGLCKVCMSMLDDQNHRLAERWLSGSAP